MTTRYRSDDSIAIIGAGIIGVSIGWHLIKRGFPVVIYDPNEPGSGCSSGNAGAISPGSVVPLAMPGLLASVPGMMLNPAGALHIPMRYWLAAFPWLARFVAAARPSRVLEISTALSAFYGNAIDHHVRLLTEVGALDVIRQTGQLHLYRSRQHLQENQGDWKLRASHGVEFEIMDRAGIEALEPQVGEAYQVGVFLPKAAMSVNPLRQVRAIASAVAGVGAEFRRERVRAIEHDGDTITGVTSESGSRRHRAVVVAAGAWSATLLRGLGYKVPLEAQRGYHVDFRNSNISLSRPIVPADRKVFITPMETGLRVAGTVEIAGLEASPSEARAKLLYNDLKAALPSASVAQPDPSWMGHRPCLPDSLPVIGETQRWPGLMCAFGHGHLGLSASAVTGDLVGRLLAGEPSLLNMHPFRLERF
ncbi:MAG TPA: FAD-dependent oxidoreductase [Devosiaceae bacterium]|nr:FAD-dependent oxidoreductase [Devosiaceae bacterium]